MTMTTTTTGGESDANGEEGDDSNEERSSGQGRQERGPTCPGRHTKMHQDDGLMPTHHDTPRTVGLRTPFLCNLRGGGDLFPFHF